MIEYIPFKNEKYPIRIKYRALKGFTADTGLSLSDLMKADENTPMKMEHFEVLLWWGLVAGHKIVEKEMTLSRDLMEDVLDESFDEFIDIVRKFQAPKNQEPSPTKKKG